VHEISEPDWLDEMADEVRRVAGSTRQVHLVLENERNEASHLRRDIDAQWNDDGHHAFHVLLTGESAGYYKDYAEAGSAGLARVMAEGFFFQGQISQHRGKPRGTPSKDLPTTAFVLFLQNHDQVGNRAFGERLTQLAEPAALEAAIAAQILCPQIPMLFMGEEVASRTPFLFFTDHDPELGKLVREGRRKEFAHFAEFSDPEKRERIPDPTAASPFQASTPRPDPPPGLGPAAKAGTTAHFPGRPPGRGDTRGRGDRRPGLFDRRGPAAVRPVGARGGAAPGARAHQLDGPGLDLVEGLAHPLQPVLACRGRLDAVQLQQSL